MLEDGAPLVLLDTVVVPEWVDYNGHMNDAAYALVFSRACDRWMEKIALGDEVRRTTGYTLFTLQIMLHYFREAKLGAHLRVVCQLLESDDKRARLWMEIRCPHDDTPFAATEQLYLSVRLGEAAHAAPWRAGTRTQLESMSRAQRDLTAPLQAGRGISLRRV